MKLQETDLSPKSSKSPDDVNTNFSGQQNRDLKNLFLTTVQSCCVLTAGLKVRSSLEDFISNAFEVVKLCICFLT